MPVARSADHPAFDLGGNRITGLAAPSSGATECILYRVDVPPGGSLPPHRHDHLDVFALLEGSGAVHIDDEVHEIRAGDSVVVPAGARHWVDAGDAGCTMAVTMLAGTLFIRDDGTSNVPPWGQ